MQELQSNLDAAKARLAAEAGIAEIGEEIV